MMADDLILALDPCEFSRSIGIDPDPWQQEVLTYEGKRMLLNCCRQSGKSTTTSIKALHTALYKPNQTILIVSPSLRQSQELFKKIKTGMSRMNNKPRLLEDNKLSLTLLNGSRIISLPSDPATVRGYSGVNLILLDEASQVQDSLYSTILPMLMIQDGQLIVMSTPFGKRGFFYEEWQTNDPVWKRIEITAKMCPRITEKKLAEQRRRMSDMFYRQEYLCKFEDNNQQTFSTESILRAFTDDFKPFQI